MLIYRLISKKTDVGSSSSEEREEVLASSEHHNPPQLSDAAKFCMLTKFMLPLVITHMVPDIAEQVDHDSELKLNSVRRQKLFLGLAAHKGIYILNPQI